MPVTKNQLISLPAVFTSRFPRDEPEIDTCIAMLGSTPLAVSNFYTRYRSEIVGAMKDVLTSGRGTIIIMECSKYEISFSQYSNKHFNHHFHTCVFSLYVTPVFAEQLVRHDNGEDAVKRVFEAYIAHPNGALCPLISEQEIRDVHNRKPERGVCNFVFNVVHPAIDPRSPKVLLDAWPYVERIKKDMMRTVGGLSHNALICNVYSDDMRDGYQLIGNTLVRGYEGNDERTPLDRRYLFCRTKTPEISDALGVPQNIKAHVGSQLINFYDVLFHQRQQLAGLNDMEQTTCLLYMLGFTPQDIADRYQVSGQQVSQWQLGAGAKLFDAYRYQGRRSKERILQIILDNPHEVRSVVVPVYPWPADLTMR